MEITPEDEFPELVEKYDDYDEDDVVSLAGGVSLATKRFFGFRRRSWESEVELNTVHINHRNRIMLV